MKVGILGSGDVAKALGKGFLAVGHDVMLGSRDAGKVKGWSEHAKASHGTFAEAAAPDARFVKAFSCVGNPFMFRPNFPGGPPTMFICGNDDGAKDQVKGILKDFGWESEDIGKVEGARAIEPLCQLWCAPGFLRNQWTHAFKLLKL